MTSPPATHEPQPGASAAESGLIEVDPALPGFYATAPEPLPFAPKLAIRAFLLRREQGNVLVYASPAVEAAASAIDALGGVARRYLNHGHEAMFLPDPIRAPLFVHEADRDSVVESAEVGGTFSHRHRAGDDLEVIPIPGHTPGATAYLWETGGRRLLFSGDTLMLRGDEWIAAVLDSSDRASYLESLELIRELDFDILVPWASRIGGPYHAPTDREATRRRIDALIERLHAEGGRR